LPTTLNDVNCSNMKAALVMRERIALDEDSFVELVIWRLPEPLDGSEHNFKYRLAFVRQDICVMRYDNEAGKGDHKHLGRTETNYVFSGLDQLQRDFWQDVQVWRQR
jgi:Family of unknown function (DUF6516)